MFLRLGYGHPQHQHELEVAAGLNVADAHPPLHGTIVWRMIGDVDAIAASSAWD